MRSLPPTHPATAPEPITLEQRLGVVRDVFIAPGRAFAALLVSPSWIIAYALGLLASGIYMLATQPAVTRLTALLDPKIGAHPTPAQLADVTTRSIETNAFAYAIEPLVFWGMSAITFSIVARFKQRRIPFRTGFALAANCSLPSAIGSLVAAAGVAARPPDSFQTLQAFVTAVPDNLAVFAVPGRNQEAAFLASFGLFDVWSALLLAYGFVAFAQVRLTTALVLSFGLAVIFVLYTVYP